MRHRPLPRVPAAFAAKTPPLPRVPTALRGQDTAFASLFHCRCEIPGYDHRPLGRRTLDSQRRSLESLRSKLSKDLQRDRNAVLRVT